MSTGWRKSSHSAGNGACLEWRTSSYSNSGSCVQVAPGIQVRDSKDPDGPVLSFPGSTWGKWISAVKRGEGVAV